MWIYVFIIIFVIFGFYQLRDNEFYQLISIFGKKGSGKTSFIAKESQRFIKKGYKVYCNISVAGTYLFDIKDMGYNTFERGSVVFIDEVGILWNNRDYKNFKRCLIEWFKLHRHYHVRVYIFSQALDYDVTLQRITDSIYITRRLGKISFLVPVRRKIDLGHDSSGNGGVVDNLEYGSIFGIKFMYLPRYYGFFDSFEAPELPVIKAVYRDYNELSGLYVDSKKWFLLQLRTSFLSFKQLFFRKKMQ